jgi:hypothetical protein
VDISAMLRDDVLVEDGLFEVHDLGHGLDDDIGVLHGLFQIHEELDAAHDFVAGFSGHTAAVNTLLVHVVNSLAAALKELFLDVPDLDIVAGLRGQSGNLCPHRPRPQHGNILDAFHKSAPFLIPSPSRGEG